MARNSPGAVTRRNPRLSKRASFTESLVNNITGGGYYASVSVGTPGQDINMVLDTGSSDAFIVASGADLCESPRLQLVYQTTCGQTCKPFFSYVNSPARVQKTVEMYYYSGLQTKTNEFTNPLLLGISQRPSILVLKTSS